MDEKSRKNAYQLTHYSPPICFDVPFDGTYGTLIRCATKIEDVTCSKCIYYFYHPDARALELDFRMKNLHNN
jgi:hypothetical protein